MLESFKTLISRICSLDVPTDPLATMPRLVLTSTQTTGNSWPVHIDNGAVPFAVREYILYIRGKRKRHR